MTDERAHPFDLIFGEMASSRFAPIRAAVGPAAVLDVFLMSEPAISLLRDLRPDEGLGDARDDFMAFVHAAYRFWEDGAHTAAFDVEETHAFCSGGAASATPVRGVRYIQIAPRLIWASLDGGEHFEPLDGWFAVPTDDGMRVIAAFGLHMGRPGLSVLMVEGPPPEIMESRADGSPHFAPTMSGGDVAGLYSVASLEELLLLAWRANAADEDR